MPIVGKADPRTGWAPTPPPEPSALRSALGHATNEAIPTAAFIAGAEPGAAVGMAAGGPLGAIAGGLVTGIPAAWAASTAQGAAVQAMPGVAHAVGIDPETLQQEEQAHPVASAIGGMIPQALAFRPSPTSLLNLTGRNGAAAAGSAAVAHVGGAAIGGGVSAAQQYADTGNVDLLSTAESAGMGALLTEPTAIGRSIQAGGRAFLPSSLRGHGAPVAQPQDDAGPGPSTGNSFDLMHAVGQVESGNNPGTRNSSKGAVGQYQLEPATAQWVASEKGITWDPTKLNDPDYNRQLADGYMDILHDHYGGDQFKAVTAYHAGPGNVDRWSRPVDQGGFGDPNEIGHEAWLNKLDAAGFHESAAYPRKVMAAGGVDSLHPDQPHTFMQDPTKVAGLDDTPADDPWSQSTVLQRMRQAGADDSGKPLSATKDIRKTATTVAKALNDATPDVAEQALDAHQSTLDKALQDLTDNHENGVLDPKQAEKKFAELTQQQQAVSQGRQLLSEYYNHFPELKPADVAPPAEAAPAAPQQPTEAAQPLGADASHVIPTPDTAAAAPTPTSPLVKPEPRVVIPDAPAAITDAHTKARMAVLENILADPATKNPVRRFRAELIKRGLSDDGGSAPLPHEADRIARFEDAHAAFNDPTQPDHLSQLEQEKQAAQAAEQARQAAAHAAVRDSFVAEQNRQDAAFNATAYPPQGWTAPPTNPDHFNIPERPPTQRNLPGMAHASKPTPPAEAEPVAPHPPDAYRQQDLFPGERPLPGFPEREGLSGKEVQTPDNVPSGKPSNTGGKPNQRDLFPDRTTRIRDRANTAAEPLGSSRREWFKKGVDNALGLAAHEAPDPASKSKAKWFEDGRKFVEQEHAHQDAEHGAEPRGVPADAGAAGASDAAKPAVADAPPKTSKVLDPEVVKQRLINRRGGADKFNEAVVNAEMAGKVDQKTGLALRSMAEASWHPDNWKALDNAIAEKATPKARIETETFGDAGAADRAAKTTDAADKLNATDEFLRQQATVTKELRSQLDRMGLKDVGVRAVHALELWITHGKTGIAGDYFQRMIRIALSDDPGLMREHLNHEVVHALKDMGLFTQAEWSALGRRAAETGYMKWAAKQYPDASLSMRLEEAIAEMHADWATNQPHPTGFVGRILQKVQGFFNAIKRAFNKAGITNANQVLKDIQSGHIASRDRMAAPVMDAGDAAARNTGPLARVTEPKDETKPLNPVEHASVVVAKAGQHASLALRFTRDVAETLERQGVPSAMKLFRAKHESISFAKDHENGYADVVNKVQGLTNDQRKSLNKYLVKSTMKGEWGYEPEHLKGKVTPTPELKAQFKALDPKAQEIAKAVFKQEYDSLNKVRATLSDATKAVYQSMIDDVNGDPKATAKLTKEMNAELSRNGAMMTVDDTKPYTSLVRHGNYVVVGKSNEFAAAEKAKDWSTVAKLTSDPSHYFVDFAPGKADAINMERRIKGRFDQTDHYEKTKDVHTPTDTFASLAKLRDEAASMKSPQAGELAKLANELYLRSLAESSARKSQLHRELVAADDNFDAMRSFTLHGKATSNFLASLAKHGEITGALKGMRDEAKTSTVGTRDEREAGVNEMFKRYLSDSVYGANPLVAKIMRFNGMRLIATSPGFYLEQIMQPWQYSLPVLMGEHGGKAVTETMRAMKEIAPILGRAGISDRLRFDGLEKIKAFGDTDVRTVVQALHDMGSFDTGVSQDFMPTDPDEGTHGKVWNKIERALRLGPSNMEAFNRVFTGVTSYRLARGKGMTHQDALHYADRINYLTHGDYSTFNRPSVMGGRNPMMRMAMQFKLFSFIQAGLYGRLLHDTFKGEDADTRWAAARSLTYLLGATGTMAGIIGMPGISTANTVFALASRLMGHDDPDTLDQKVTERLAKMGITGPIAEMLGKGLPLATLGVDTSEKLGAGHMFEALPWQDVPGTIGNKDKTAQWVANLLGPTAGYLETAAQSEKYFEQGDVQRAIEGMLPTGLMGISKAMRYATRGVQTSKGDEVLRPDELGAADLVFAALGLNSKMLEGRAERSEEVGQATDAYKNREDRLTAAFLYARKNGDGAKMDALRNEWMAIQQDKMKQGLRPTSASELMKAATQQMQREHRIRGGVEFNRGNVLMVQRLLAMEGSDGGISNPPAVDIP